MQKIPVPGTSNNEEDKQTNEKSIHSDPSSGTSRASPVNSVDRCTILHDSLLRKVNNTLLRREGVGVTKVWAPDIGSMQQEVQNLKPTETIVL